MIVRVILTWPGTADPSHEWISDMNFPILILIAVECQFKNTPYNTWHITPDNKIPLITPWWRKISYQWINPKWVLGNLAEKIKTWSDFQWNKNKVGYQMGGGFECILDKICGNESKRLPVLIIISLLHWSVDGEHVTLKSVIDPRD